MEENMINLEEIDVEGAVDIAEDLIEKNDGSIKKILTGMLVTGGVMLIAVAIKKRNEIKEKQTERRIKKLEKDGYVVYKPEDTEEKVESDSEVEETEE